MLKNPHAQALINNPEFKNKVKSCKGVLRNKILGKRVSNKDILKA
jgi:hypothetical protein